MRKKRLLAALCGIVLAMLLAMTPVFAFAAVTLVNGVPTQLLGNPQSSTPNYSMAWLDNVVIRDDATAVTTARLVPRASYPYSKTYAEFVEEVSQYAQINDVDETTVATAYDEAAQMLYYLVVALGMTDELPAMEAYLTEQGIALPENPQPDDTAKVAIVYAALRYNAIYALYGKEVTFAKGITLDQAEIAIMAELTNVFLPSGVDSMTGFAVQAMRTHVEEFNKVPISADPSNSEVFHWVKILTAAGNDYAVPLTPYAEATSGQKAYVDYAYYASIFTTVYDVSINPVRLAQADASDDELAVQRLLLTSMLDEKEVPYSNTATTEELFDMACECGYFDLEEEFYSDVFNYDLYVKPDCEKLWFTPFPLASQLGGDDSALTIYLGNTQMKPSSTAYYLLDVTRASEPVDLTVIYNNGAPDVQRIVYNFNVIKTGEANLSLANGTDLKLQLQTYADNILPGDNAAVNATINTVIDTVQGQTSDLPAFDLETMTTYGYSVPTDASGLPAINVPGELATDLLPGGDSAVTYDPYVIATYAPEETAVLTIPTGDDAIERGGDDSAIARATTVIKENPEILAAPTGILAFGGLVGYLWNKKRKDALNAAEKPADDKPTEIPNLFD
ncbi:MAG: hypothetical protein IKN72_00060 [Clostridia bacterium]|nr:hypothetical protein [Clostridia bacterium]